MPDILFISSALHEQRIFKLAINSLIKAFIAKTYKVLKVPVPSGITLHPIRNAATNVAFIWHATVEEIFKAAILFSLYYRRLFDFLYLC